MNYKEIGNGKLQVECKECGKTFIIDDFRNADTMEMADAILESGLTCSGCENARIEAERKEEFYNSFSMHIEDACIPRSLVCKREDSPYDANFIGKPIVRGGAEFFWKFRKNHILLSGNTGVGKSTSACFVAIKAYLEKAYRVTYTTFAELSAEWRTAKKSDRPNADRAMLHQYLRTNDLVIIDEVIGNNRITEAGSELLFEIIDSCYNGRSKARVWLLGNFYVGSLKEVFAEPDAVIRRLDEAFVCATLQNGGIIEMMELNTTTKGRN